MSEELKKAGHDVNWAIINDYGAVDDIQNLIDKCTMPIFQDTKEMGAWGKHGGSKDDIIIYDAKGKLFAFVTVGGAVDVNLSDDKAYAKFKQLVIDATIL